MAPKSFHTGEPVADLKRFDGTSTDGHTNTHLVLTAARDKGSTIRVDTNAADTLIVAAYL